MQGPASIDFETTDKEHEKAHAVEVAIFGLDNIIQELIKPPILIPIETSAIHHITDKDVEYCRNWNEVKAGIRAYVDHLDPKILVAHNAEYEQGILKEGFEDVIWICTYKCALVFWPDAPNHKNETLRYMLNLPELGRKHSHSAHTALHDARVTFQILQELLKLTTLDTLIQITKEPKQFSKISFGKHAGSKWAEIDSGYLNWICNQTTMDKDIVSCAKKELDRRRMANATPRSN
jgi:exodeoxyribonuclease X